MAKFTGSNILNFIVLSTQYNCRNVTCTLTKPANAFKWGYEHIMKGDNCYQA